MGAGATAVPKDAELLTLDQVCQQFQVIPGWVYKRTYAGAADPLPVVHLGRKLRFPAAGIRAYVAARQKPRTNATLIASDGIARVNGKDYRRLTRRRFQTGSVRLREDRKQPWWEGFYREDVVDDSGQIRRKRKSVNLGLRSDLPTKRAAQRKLADILATINDADYRPRSTITFRGFVEKYKELQLKAKKGTTQAGYLMNLRKHFVPFFGEMQLAEVDTEVVQVFINQKITDGYEYNTIKNLKWGLSAVFEAAVKYKYIKSNPARAADLPPEGIREQPTLPKASELDLLIDNLPEPLATVIWTTAVTCIRPEELAFKWRDLDVEKRYLWIVRAVNRGKLHTPKYHRSNRPIQLTEADVDRLLELKKRMQAGEDDWMFPNSRKTGPIVHEQILGRVVQPVARKLGLPHITWRLLRHWGTTQMMEAKVPIKAQQERLGHTRPDILLRHYAHVLEPSAEFAAETLSSKLASKSAAKKPVLPESGSQTAATPKKWVM